jgi:hypothetical protein
MVIMNAGWCQWIENDEAGNMRQEAGNTRDEGRGTKDEKS